MNTHHPFPKIRQYHQVLKHLILQHTYVGQDGDDNPIYDRSLPLPTVSFTGQVKLHGTNAAIVFNPDGSFYCQSRENVVTEEKDNAGFAHWVSREGHKIFDRIPYSEEKVIVFGEWCGGSIQKGVALNKLDKMFVIFGAKLVDSEDLSAWVDAAGIEDPEHKVFNISSIPSYEISVDLARPDKAIEQMAAWVDEIDRECPFSKSLGVIGHGEGLVFRLTGSHDFSLAFKCKGESHSRSKIRKLPKVDVEKMDNIHQAVETHCHEDRLQQGWDVVVNSPEKATPENIGDFIRWVVNDIWEEEGDSIRESDISHKEIGGAVSKVAARWFQENLRKTL